MRQTGEGDLLLNAAEAAGASTVNIDAKGYDILGVQVSAAAADATGTLEIQGTIDAANWVALQLVNANSGALATSVATSDSGLYYVPISAYSGVRANLTAYTDGTISVEGYRQVGGGAMPIFDVDISDVSSDLADSDVALFAADTATAAIALQLDTSTEQALYVANVWAIQGLDTAAANLSIQAATDTEIALYVDNVRAIQGLDTGGVNLGIQAATDTEIALYVHDVHVLSGLDTSGANVDIGADTITGNALHVWMAATDMQLYALDTGGGAVAVGVDTDNRLNVTETWNSTMQNSTTLAIQDKDFEVPADLDWHVLWIWIQYTSNASAGARQLRIDVEGSDTAAAEPYLSIIPGVTQAASLTYRYSFAPGNADLTATRDSDYISTPLPSGLILPELHQLRIFDQAVITGGDTAGENMIVKLMVMDRARVDS